MIGWWILVATFSVGPGIVRSFEEYTGLNYDPLAASTVRPAWKKVNYAQANRTRKRFAVPNFETVETDEEDDVTDNFITGGRTARRGGYPYSVSLQAYDGSSWSHICGGAIVARNRVITAAHCLHNWANYTYRICANCYDLDNIDDKAQIINVSEAIVHPLYNRDNPYSPSQSADIAVLNLAKKIKLTSQVKVVELSTNSRLTYRTCDLTGYGHPSLDAGDRSSMLQRSGPTVMKDSDCRKTMRIVTTAQIHKTNLCTLAYPKLTSGCTGDGGAPLVCLNKLAGILSWGLDSCNGCTPDVHTRINSHAKWLEPLIGIKSKTGKSDPRRRRKDRLDEEEEDEE